MRALRRAVMKLKLFFENKIIIIISSLSKNGNYASSPRVLSKVGQINKSSAVAEMGDRLATIDMSRTLNPPVATRGIIAYLLLLIFYICSGACWRRAHVVVARCRHR